MSETTTIVPTEGPNNAKQDLVSRLAGASPSEPAAAQHVMLASTLATQMIDPILKGVHDALDAAQESIRHALLPPSSYLFGESQESFSDPAAKKRVDHDQAVVNARRATGSTIDARVPGWLRIAGLCAPWAESLGILVYVTFLWNVYWLRPWEDWLTFATALVLVIGVPLMQKFFAEHAGRAHNSYRQAATEDFEPQARSHKTTHNWHLAGTFIVASIGMIILAVRGVIALDEPDPAEIAIVISMALIVGYGAAVLAYAAIAFDGTSTSRESEELTAQGEAHAEEWLSDVESVEEHLEQAANDERLVIESVFPKILETVRHHHDGNQVEDITNLQPLIERAKRLVQLRERRVALEQQLKSVKQKRRPAFLLNP